ncbi:MULTISPECIES: D-alanine--D-alanine ligase family protein [unclassified Microbacterium]|uniref:D-alanine--D-alanine ligase family protein n=1 Tax=unclassified Microbacterium TaxID=2609290 RepID=UPI000C5824D4|nr:MULTISPECIES: D-alanine--D-alanine ligase family protein [unclassified Microbacterium]MAY48331.1 D-alanine--D-alanine ligase [Microbacterium sp.]HBR89110.1 D-alanine--D-alanine ligase [Microbacterium sp.]HBS74314.1 D-alanine--D-alanine ligase [Microbacterium sp.]|tara:strand:- start:2010 stop:3092 length:1083 start_codon:yes stop_codon:yes gene_type:complete
MDKRAVAVLFGGRSSEHSISSATAGGVLRAIDRDRFDVIPVGITRSGAYVLEDDDPEKFALDPSRMPEVVDNGTRIVWPDSAETRELRVRDAAGERSLGRIDVVLPILHGRFGEDGTVQGFLELLDIPYAGAGVLMSAIGMDKHTTKSVLKAAGVPVVPWVTVTRADLERDRAQIEHRVRALDLPVFVKPARAGSSVGVTKVADLSDLDAALETAFAEDDTVLVEKAVTGREIECGVLPGRDGGLPRVSLPGEIVITGREFYDFEAKYLGAPGVELVCPAQLRDGEMAEMQRVAARAFEAVGGEGLARVDFFFTGTDFFVNEVNTMPGFTPISMFPACWIATGMTYTDLISELIDGARER